MWMLHLGLAVALLTAGPASVLAQATEDLPGDPVAGRTLAEEVCSACHALPGWEPTVAAPGALPFEDLAASMVHGPVVDTEELGGVGEHTSSDPRCRPCRSS